MDDKHLWMKTEYEEVNRYGRTLYESILRLAQMTFVINPALAAGIYYIYYNEPNKLNDAWWVGLFIAFLGVVYNVGAAGVYRSSHAFLERLLIRLREIDEGLEMTTHRMVEVTAPYSYREYWKNLDISIWRRYFSADYLTRLFLLLLAAAWALLFCLKLWSYLSS